jgi:RNA-splicing ligase RtcB
MIILNGKYNEAKVFTDNIEESAKGQIVELLNQEFVKEERVRIMPDVHAGAGRICSRGKARERFSMDEFKSEMDGIYSTCVNESTLDESPMAYKPMDEIIKNIGDTVEIKKVIKPIYNFKAN